MFVTSRRVRFLLALIILCGLYLSFTERPKALADVNQFSKPINLISVSTSEVTTVNLTNRLYQFTHIAFQADGTTASVAGDLVMLMDGEATMDVSLADGAKMPIFAGGNSGTLRGSSFTQVRAGSYSVKLKASGHGAKILITMMGPE